MLSSDITAKASGDLGYFPRGMIAKPFENFCLWWRRDFGLVPTQFGFRIIITNQEGENTAYKIGQVIRKSAASMKPFKRYTEEHLLMRLEHKDQMITER